MSRSARVGQQAPQFSDRVDHHVRSGGHQVVAVAGPPGDGDRGHARGLGRQDVDNRVPDVDALDCPDAEALQRQEQRFRVRACGSAVSSIATSSGRWPSSPAARNVLMAETWRFDVTTPMTAPEAASSTTRSSAPGYSSSSSVRCSAFHVDVAVDQFLGSFGVPPRESSVERLPNPASRLTRRGPYPQD